MALLLIIYILNSNYGFHSLAEKMSKSYLWNHKWVIYTQLGKSTQFSTTHVSAEINKKVQLTQTSSQDSYIKQKNQIYHYLS